MISQKLRTTLRDCLTEFANEIERPLAAACAHAGTEHDNTSPPRQQGPHFRLQNVVLPTGPA